MDEKNTGLKSEVEFSLNKLEEWLIENNWKAYDPFEGLNSWLRPLTFEVPVLRQLLVQFVKRTPLNIRPFIGIQPTRSSKGLAYIVLGDILRYKMTNDDKYKSRIKIFLDWLIENSCKGYSGYCWGNHFDYQTRGYFLQKNNPTLVWTALTGKAFVEAYLLINDQRYADVVDSACNFIIKDLPRSKEQKGECISYVTNKLNFIHNANLLGAGFLSLGYKITGNEEYKKIAEQSIVYSAASQLSNGAWYYGEEKKYHWIDNWHTAYNLDSIQIYQESTGDRSFEKSLINGFDFYFKNFFTSEGIPKFYYNKLLPIDIQSCSQSIDTLVNFKNYSNDKLALAIKVAGWTIDNMQDKTGYFYYKRNKIVSKVPTFHWGQGTMYHALSNLLFQLEKNK